MKKDLDPEIEFLLSSRFKFGEKKVLLRNTRCLLGRDGRFLSRICLLVLLKNSLLNCSLNTDKFWKQQKGNTFPVVAESIQEEIEKYKQYENELKSLKDTIVSRSHRVKKVFHN